MSILKCTVVVALSLAAGSAWAAKSCDELKSEIAAKIDAKGVKAYSLNVVAADAVGEGKVVGSCGGDKQRIVYQRGVAAKP